MRFFTLLLCLYYSQVSVLGQKLVEYSVNVRDTSLYRSAEYQFNALHIKNIKSDLYSIIEKLSVENSAEMYILRFNLVRSRIFITIQNWEYRGISSIKSSNIYGLFKFQDRKEILICYDDVRVIKFVRKFFSKTGEKRSISIHIKTIPDNVYIPSNDLTTYYQGLLTRQSLKTVKLVVNNKQLLPPLFKTINK